MLARTATDKICFDVYNIDQALANVTLFVKTQYDTFLEIQIFASVSSMYLKLSSAAISMLCCK